MAINFKSYILTSLYPRLLIAGHYSGCHQLDERSFHIGIRKFPVCARCTGIAIGLPLGVALLALHIKVVWFALIVMAFPMVIDGVAQLVTKYESNNMRRFITGLLFGVGIMHAMILAIERVL